jgi:hypothetical protein
MSVLTRFVPTVLALSVAASTAFAQADSTAVSAGITPQEIDVTLHEPVTAVLTVQNGLSWPVTLNLGDDRKNEIVVKTIFPDGNVRSNRVAIHEGLARMGRVTVAPGGSYSQVLMFNDWTDFPLVGPYRLQVEILRPIVASDGASISIGPFSASVKVVSRDAQRLDGLCASALERLSRASSYSAAREATEYLTHVEDPVAVPFLRRAMFSSSYPVQPLIVQGLERLASPEAVKVLLEALGEGSSARPEARAALTRLLSRVSEEDVKTEIRQALDGKTQDRVPK